MKTRLLFLSIILLIISRGHLNAETISVVNGDDLQAKVDSASAGDILVISAGQYLQTVKIDKKLTLIGPGYFKLQGGTAYINSIWLDVGSDGSMLTGLVVSGNLNIASSNNLVSRNKIDGTLYLGYTNINYATSNNKVVQNYFGSQNASIPGIKVGNSAIVIQTNYQISNNVVMNSIGFTHSMYSTGLVVNNIFDPDSTNIGNSAGQYISVSGGISSVSFYNNIFKGGFCHSTTTTGSTIFSTSNPLYHPLNFKYNIIDTVYAGYTIPVDNLVTTERIFAGYPTIINGMNNADARILLDPTGPAVGFGRSYPYSGSDPTTDAGVFGGSLPYVLSGIPVGPQVYEMVVPPLAATNSTITVKVKARSNN
ncbi:hypothetical protein [Jiulongibacter sediminis]|jgi:hypothetical protein|uniref:hypothetical protein n=1 Tax=Jiulongibacter sediminis TaxID=1605367 RepID=UPI0026ECD03C|nr:hypothetical protein [Jiulongibacter sediminis]